LRLREILEPKDWSPKKTEQYGCLPIAELDANDPADEGLNIKNFDLIEVQHALEIFTSTF